MGARYEISDKLLTSGGVIIRCDVDGCRVQEVWGGPGSQFPDGWRGLRHSSMDSLEPRDYTVYLCPTHVAMFPVLRLFPSRMLACAHREQA